MMSAHFTARQNRRTRSVVAVAAALSVSLGLAACSGGSEPKPTVTKTVNAPAPSQSATGSAAPASDPTPSTSVAPSPTKHAEPVTIDWVQVDRKNEPGHLATETLSVPTLKNATEQVKKAFDAQVSSKVQKMRKFLLDQQTAMLQYNDENDPGTQDLLAQSYLKSSRSGSTVYKGRYASAIVDLDGAEGGGTHMTKVAFSVTVDVTNGKVVPLTEFVGVSKSQLDALLTDYLKEELKKDGAAEDPFRLLQNVDMYEWMVSDEGVTFRYLSIYEGGWDYTFTIPWDQLSA